LAVGVQKKDVHMTGLESLKQCLMDKAGDLVKIRCRIQFSLELRST
jgi:hypothetical protein